MFSVIVSASALTADVRAKGPRRAEVRPPGLAVVANRRRRRGVQREVRLAARPQEPLDGSLARRRVLVGASPEHLDKHDHRAAPPRRHRAPAEKDWRRIGGRVRDRDFSQASCT